MTLREQLAAHRRSPRCAGCHQEMDPLGLSLENYDRFGAYRRRYDEGEGRRVDARGQLPDGTAFEGLPGLRQALLDTKYQDLARQLTRKMLAYALGRQLEYYDEKTVREIVRHLEASAIPLQDLVKQVVSSYPFQYKMKRPQN